MPEEENRDRVVKTTRFGIEQFRSEIAKNGILQTNRFLVIISLPYTMRTEKNEKNDVNDTLIMRCWQAVVPGVNMFTFDDVRRHGIGQIEKRPYLPTFNPAKLDFIVDQNSEVLKFFDTWCNKVVNHNTDLGLQTVDEKGNYGRPYLLKYPDEYMSPTVRIWVYDQKNDQTIGVKLYDVFPLITSDIDLNWSSQNEPMQFSVNLQFTHMSKQFFKEPQNKGDQKHTLKSKEETVDNTDKKQKKNSNLVKTVLDGIKPGEIHSLQHWDEVKTLI